ncbi:MAG TPA: FkbM family methyltransferase, partial [Tepidisphaeraceae bacterium]|nr:FkbM family methyltransferase [Tepidisphaeraceae bacterium]
NAGFFTLVAAKIVGPNGKCVAFDPAPANIESIREQIELNSLSYCQAVQQAMGAAVGESTFSFVAAGSASGHLGKGDATDEQIVVQVTTFDTACAQFSPPDMVKMDIEGAETLALPSAQRLLSEFKPTWLIELHSPEGWREVTRILRSAGYDLFDIDNHPVRDNAPWPHHVIARHPAAPAVLGQ